MPVDAEQPPRLPFPVVGIGASAGGLEAITEFLSQVRPDSGMAYVFIQHLPPTGESMLVDILSKRADIPVQHIEDGGAVEANRLYVIRPGFTVTIKDGRFHLGQRLTAPMANRPVDDFFKSLAEEQRERAIAVILSGMGSNGTAGAQAIKAVGGLCIAQDPETTQYPSMPRHLIDAGYADYILTAPDMPAALLAYAGHPYASGKRESRADLAARDQQHLREILAILRTRTHQDFTGYKKPTIVRRVQRRMGLNRVTRIGEYARMLRQTPNEVAALADDLLIHVTGFFRDPKAWDALREQVIVPLVAARRNDESIRCWVTACSSGEEAYTLAMLLVEETERSGKILDIKVFATDMAERSLASARGGIFPGGIESEITAERLQHFFQRDDAVYRVRPELRERVVFAPQNLLQDPPFSRLDIASCRNLLIYLEPEMQTRILGLLHFGLREGGTLFLGTSETVSMDAMFEPIDKAARIYRRIGPTRHGSTEFPLPRRQVTSGLGPLARGNTPRPTMSQLINRTLLEHHTPAAVAIDRDGKIVYFHGNTDPFFGAPRGEPTRDALELARDSVRGAMRSAIQRAYSTNQTATVLDGTMQPEPGKRVRIAVVASPLDVRNSPGYLIVSFQEIGLVPDEAPPVVGENTSQHEVRRIREELQSAVEELQASNEELKASHEEVVSTNEELQSTNEELETSREEMQSLNEELNTVNAQLRVKMEEHQAASNDLTSLLASTNIAVLFLDPKFRIRRFTAAIRDLMDVIQGDIGRSVSDLAKKFDDPNLLSDAEAVLTKLVPSEREVTATSGKGYIRRITPYRTADDHIDGVVVTFVDVTERKRAERAVGESQAWMAGQKEAFQSAINGQPLAESLGALVRTVVQQTGGEARAAFYMIPPGGKGLTHVVGMPDEYAKAVNGFEVGPESLACGLAMHTGQPVITPDVESDPLWIKWRTLSREFDYRGCWSFPVRIDGGAALGTFALYFRQPRQPTPRELELAGVMSNTAAIIISRHLEGVVRAAAEAALRAVEPRLRAVADNLPNGAMFVVDHDMRYVLAGGQALGPAGHAPADLEGKTVAEVLPAGLIAEHTAQWRKALAGEPFRTEHTAHGRHYITHGVPLRDDTGAVAAALAVSYDITDRKQAEAALRQREDQLRLIVEGAHDFAIIMLDPQGRITGWNTGATRLMGYTETDAVGQPGAIIYTSEDRRARVPEQEMELATTAGRAPDERWHLCKDKSRFWGSGTLAPLRDPDGSLRGFVKIMRDDTQRKRAEQSLRSSKEAAEEANRVKDEFLATLSHELRTPLTAILLWTKLMRTGAVEQDKVKEGLKAIEDSAEAQKSLIEDLLDTSRITTGNLRLQMRDVDLRTVVQSAVDAVQPTADAKDVVVTTDLAADVGVVRADPDRVRQVVWNLLTNAVKFTPAEGTVSVGLWRREGGVVIRVSDTGRGIEPDFLPHVFERFRQADSSHSRDQGGLGLGLAIAKQLVELHGGTITVQSEGIGKGATLEVNLPVQRVGKRGRGAGRTLVKQTTGLEGIRLLLVEDDAATRGAMVTLLRRAGVDVVEAQSAADALAEFDRLQLDVVVCDIGLPDGDGLQLIRQIREREKNTARAAVPAIALTAFATDKDQAAVIAAGFGTHLSKPVDPGRLLQAVRDITS